MPAKRAKKQTARKRVTPRKLTRKSRAQKGKMKKMLRSITQIFVLLLAIAALYYFAPFETRAKMDRMALTAIDAVRTHESTPAFASQILDTAHDAIPSSAGLVVDGSELGRDPSMPFIAGTPNSRFPIIPLIQPSYINLFSERSMQASCIAFRLDSSDPQKAKSVEAILPDSRVPILNEQTMTLGNWSPFQIAPSAALTRQHGDKGLKDAQLVTNYAPATKSFRNGIWKKAMRELTIRYPKRFDEVWIYLGPTNSSESAKLSSGIPIPDGFYAIVFDLTEEGGLRALALHMPTDGESNNLNDYITSIENLEKLTGMQFLPDLDFSLRDTLGSNLCPSIW